MKVYSVEIASAGALDEGFIDPKTTQDYDDFNAEAGEVSDYVAKAKGWIRWRNLIHKLSSTHYIDDVMDIEIPGAKSLVAPTSIKFFLTYDDEPSLRLDEDNILYGEDAIKESIAFVLSNDYENLAMVWNPTVDKQGDKDLMPKGADFKYVKAPKLFSGVAARNAITVKTFDVPNPTDVSLKISVTPPPPVSKVLINGVETTEYHGQLGDEITWSASAEHFITQNGALELEQDTVINVALVEVPGTVIINPTPADAVVKINNMERKSYTGKYGENVTWEVSKVGYKPKSGSLTITEDEVTIPVELEIIKVSLVINPTPADAVVTINGEAKKNITVDYGTTVSYEVSKTGYDTKSEEIELTKDTVLDVELSKTVVSLTINPTPENAVVKIAGVEQKKYVGVYGDKVDWEVSAVGYTTKSGSETLTANKSLDVALEKIKVTVTINATPEDAVVTLNGVEQKSITVDYGTKVDWVVSKTGYVSQNGSITPTANTTKDVALVLEQHTFTITPTPADAVVTINGEKRTTLTADYGTKITWSVAKTGYDTKNGTYTLTADKTEAVSLSKTQITITVAATPADAVVKINGKEQKAITVDYGTEVSYEVSKTGYVAQSGKLTATETKTVSVALVKQKVTLTVVPTPADATVKINDVEQSSITVDYGTEVSYEVSKTGYVSKTGKVSVTETKELPISLAKQQVTFTITPTPENATVKINDVAQKTVTVDYGSKVTYSVSATGYVTQSGEEILTANKTLPITLVKQKVTVTISATPEDATVKIAGKEQKSVTVDYGTEVAYEVSKTGYVTKSATITATKTETITVTLVKQQVTVTIAPTPANATVKINGEAKSAATVDYGTELSYEVSATGYDTKTGTVTATKTETISVALVKKKVTVTVAATPADATVKINGTAQKSITVDYGSEVSYEVSATGYDTKTGKETATETKTITVTLVKKKITLTVSATPADATVKLNNVEQKSITVDYGTEVSYEVSKTGYDTKTGKETATETKTITVTLTKTKVTLTVSATPADATVKLGGTAQKSITVDYGTEVAWEVSKTGYVTKSGKETVTATKTLTVALEVQKVTFAITPTPTDATVKINGTEQKSVSVNYGAEVAWEVSKTGYTARNGSETVTKDTTRAIELTIKQFTFTITPTPEDATVTINGTAQSSLKANYGTAITWSVAKDGYTEQTGNLTLTEDKTLPVTLVAVESGG